MIYKNKRKKTTGILKTHTHTDTHTVCTHKKKQTVHTKSVSTWLDTPADFTTQFFCHLTATWPKKMYFLKLFKSLIRKTNKYFAT